MNDNYGKPDVIRRKNITGNIYHPIIPKEEYDKRMEEIKKAATRLVLSK